MFYHLFYDQDANEWGGASKVHSQFTHHTDARISHYHHEGSKEDESLASKIFNTSFTSASMETIGKTLLRKLGLGDHQSVAYVSEALEYYDNLNDSSDLEHNPMEFQFLKKRGLKKVHHDSHNTPSLIIPEVKLDHFGIGFSPFKNAPEFELYHKRRKQPVYEDSPDLDGSTNYSSKRNIYCTNDLLIGEDSTKDGYELVRRKGNLSSMSARDYTRCNPTPGERTKQVTNMNLEDDEDNVYDLVSGKKIFNDEYHYEILKLKSLS